MKGFGISDQEKAWLDWLSDGGERATAQPRPGDTMEAGVSGTKEETIRGLADQVKTVEHGLKFDLGTKLHQMTGSAPTHKAVGVRPRKRPVQRLRHVAPTPTDRTLSVSLSLPDFSPIRQRLIRNIRRIDPVRTAKFVLPVIAIVGLFWGTTHWLGVRADRAEKAAASSASQQPTYAPLVSENKGEVSGATYDSKKELYMFVDNFRGVEVTVSQQPMPDKLRTRPEDIAKVAANIGAKDTVTTIHGKVYVGTDEKTGYQRLVLAHRQLLVFIQSNRTLSNSAWVEYIQTLE